MLGFRKKLNKNNEDYIVKLYQLYSAIVKKTIISKLYSCSIEDIEDCVQEVFVVAVKRLDELRGHPKLIGWFTVVAKNIAMKHNEKFLTEKHVNDKAFDDCPDTFCVEEQVVEDIMFAELIKQDVLNTVLNTLESEEKKLYNLRWVQHLRYKEIEEALALSSGAVKSRILRLRRHIEEIIKVYTG